MARPALHLVGPMGDDGRPVMMNLRTYLAAAALTVALVGCTDDEPEAGAEPDTSDTAAAGATSTSRDPLEPEIGVSAALAQDGQAVTVTGWVFEVDGTYLLCESATESDPPDCDGESIEISNGEILDPIIFVGEEGSRYSDAEVVMTGSVFDGVLTIG